MHFPKEVPPDLHLLDLPSPCRGTPPDGLWPMLLQKGKMEGDSSSSYISTGLLLQPDPTKILNIELGMGVKLKKRVVNDSLFGILLG